MLFTYTWMAPATHTRQQDRDIVTLLFRSMNSISIAHNIPYRNIERNIKCIHRIAPMYTYNRNYLPMLVYGLACHKVRQAQRSN